MQIIVLGMHRSGTSAITRVINLLGAHVGSEQELGGPAFDNPKGFWERQDLRQLNDRLLQLIGASWGDIGDFDLGRLGEDDRRTLSAEAASIVRKLDVHRPWVIKDPRLCLTLPFWRELLEVPVCVHVYRPPLEVAQSLKMRNGFSLGFGVALWESYNLHALAASRGLPRLLVSYADLIDGPVAVGHRLYRQLGELGATGLRLPDERELRAFIDHELRHHRQTDEPGQVLNAAQTALMRAMADADAGVLDWERLPELSAGARDALWAEQQYRRQLRDYRTRLNDSSAREADLEAALENGRQLADLQLRVPLIQRIDRLHGNMSRRQISAARRLANALQMPRLEHVDGSSSVNLLRGLLRGRANRPSFPAPLLPVPSDPALLQLDLLMVPLFDWTPDTNAWMQHMAIELARLGHRVWYLDETVSDDASAPGYQVVAEPISGLRVIRLCGDVRGNPDIRAGKKPQVLPIASMEVASMEVLLRDQQIDHLVVLLADPVRQALLEAIPGCLRIDCYLDPQPDYPVTAVDRLLGMEPSEVDTGSDLTVVSTAHRAAQCAERKREHLLLRPGIDMRPEDAAARSWSASRNRRRPVVGYAGAGNWLNRQWIVAAARARPQWDFVVLDRQSCKPPDDLAVNLDWQVGVPLATLKQRIVTFDVCMLPWWQMSRAFACSPIEVYEFLAAGKPVVASTLPELRELAEHLHIVGTQQAFISGLDQAMDERHDDRLVERRRRCVIDHTWTNRALVLESALLDRLPRISVVLLTYNNLSFTRTCLESLDRFTRYPNWELIIVDNASSDGSVEFLRAYQAEHEHVRLILNEDNLGFAAGNNRGLRAADGDYLVLLNNDTYVTGGWLYGLVRHLRVDESLGLIGPVTDNVGNEAKIDLPADDLRERIASARHYTDEHRGQRLTTDTLGFFCVAFSRTVLESVGFLDERFAVGYFEDDDYCRRVSAQGFGIAIAEDVFVHHRLSASFDQLGPERMVIFQRNKKLFEEKWGVWRPHRQRSVLTEAKKH